MTSLRESGSHVVPGFLQTPSYTRSLSRIRSVKINPDAYVSMRQELFEMLGNGINYTFLLDMDRIRLVLPDQRDIDEQVERLREAASIPGVKIGSTIASSLGLYTLVDSPGGVTLIRERSLLKQGRPMDAFVDDQDVIDLHVEDFTDLCSTAVWL